MNILFVIAHLGGSGGQSVQSKRLIDELAKIHNVKILTLRNGDYLDLPENCEVVADLKLSSIFKLFKKLKKKLGFRKETMALALVRNKSHLQNYSKHHIRRVSNLNLTNHIHH